MFAFLLVMMMFGAVSLPDHQLTPGVVDTTLVADLSKKPHMVNKVEHNICAEDFRTEPFRVATKSEATKKKVCEAYGIKQGCPGEGWELDDILPIEMGGKNVAANLWPQEIHEARIKDHALEDRLGGPKGLICTGKVKLKDAQDGIRTNWAEYALRNHWMTLAEFQGIGETTP